MPRTKVTTSSGPLESALTDWSVVLTAMEDSLPHGPHIKYEDLQVAMLLLNKREFLLLFDLKSGYHHVDIAECHWKYRGFAWEEKFCVHCSSLWPFYGMLCIYQVIATPDAALVL